MKIRTKVVLAFSLIVLVLTITSVSVFTYQYNLTRRYQEISQVMVSEYQMVVISEDMVEAYYNLAKTAGADENFQEYYDHKKELDNLSATLTHKVLYLPSTAKLKGVQNIIEGIDQEIQLGINEIQEQNIDNISGHYQKSRERLTYLNEATAGLILSDLEYLNDTSKRLDSTLVTSVIIGGVVIFLVFLVSLAFAFSFARTLTRPLEKLNLFAKEVAGGNTSATIDKMSFSGSDEISDLSDSFQIMVAALRGQMNSIKTVNNQLEIQTARLEEMNKAMVGREHKMMELKQEIERLRKG